MSERTTSVSGTEDINDCIDPEDEMQGQLCEDTYWETHEYPETLY